MINSVFHAQVMGLPPAEPRTTTLQAYGIEDTFETGLRPHQLAGMRELEEKAHDTIFIILSDVHLDKPVVSIEPVAIIYTCLILVFVFDRVLCTLYAYTFQL